MDQSTMSIRVMILPGRTKDSVTAAFYYPVTKTKPIAKPGAVAQSGLLDPQVADGLTSGNLIEVVKTFSFSGWPLPDIQAYLEKTWINEKDQALADAAVLADGAGTMWDGTTWA